MSAGNIHQFNFVDWVLDLGIHWQARWWRLTKKRRRKRKYLIVIVTNLFYFHEFFTGPKSNHCLVLSLSHSLGQFLLLFKLDWCNPSTWRLSKPLKIVTYALLALLAVVNFNSHVVETVTKQQPCMLMTEQNKTYVVDARWKQKQCGWCRKN